MQAVLARETIGVCVTASTASLFVSALAVSIAFPDSLSLTSAWFGSSPQDTK